MPKGNHGRHAKADSFAAHPFPQPLVDTTIAEDAARLAQDWEISYHARRFADLMHKLHEMATIDSSAWTGRGPEWNG